MNSRHITRQSILVVLLALFASAAWARTPSSEAKFVPEEGQEGKDVIWLPTAQTMVDKMLDIAKVTPKDFVIDLGSGDGRTVITAAKRGARGLGIEFNPKMVEFSRLAAAKEGLGDKAQFKQADLFETDFSKATVITMFLLPDINRRLRPKILDLKPGTRIVSNTFDMDEWKADETAEVNDDCTTYCKALLWIVPAKVNGTWKSEQGELALTQQFQMVSGSFSAGTQRTTITDGKLRGDLLRFRVGQIRYAGRVHGDVIRGLTKDGERSSRWLARRLRVPALKARAS